MSTETATDDRAATASALRQLHADHANAVEVDDICTQFNTAAVGLALAEVERLTAELTEARDLAKLALGILDEFPTDASSFDDSLRNENLPTWAGGEAETWQRGGE